MVLVGAEGVVENGGVINKLGTYQAALSAHCHNTPFYVAAESYKASSPLSYMHSVQKGCSSTPCSAWWRGNSLHCLVLSAAMTLPCSAAVAVLPYWIDGQCYVQFARLYPLGQHDLPIERKHVDFGPLCPASVRIENPSRDYTPPSELPHQCMLSDLDRRSTRYAIV